LGFLIFALRLLAVFFGRVFALVVLRSFFRGVFRSVFIAVAILRLTVATQFFLFVTKALLFVAQALNFVAKLVVFFLFDHGSPFRRARGKAKFRK
jgi:hypothetical protein